MKPLQSETRVAFFALFLFLFILKSWLKWLFLSKHPLRVIVTLAVPFDFLFTFHFFIFDSSINHFWLISGLHPPWSGATLVSELLFCDIALHQMCLDIFIVRPQICLAIIALGVRSLAFVEQMVPYKGFLDHFFAFLTLVPSVVTVLVIFFIYEFEISHLFRASSEPACEPHIWVIKQAHPDLPVIVGQIVELS